MGRCVVVGLVLVFLFLCLVYIDKFYVCVGGVVLVFSFCC